MTDLSEARRERDEALAELARERSIGDAICRQVQRLVEASRRGPAAEEQRVLVELNRLFNERGWK